jgi:hypothetical protein
MSDQVHDEPSYRPMSPLQSLYTGHDQSHTFMSPSFEAVSMPWTDSYQYEGGADIMCKNPAGSGNEGLGNHPSLRTPPHSNEEGLSDHPPTVHRRLNTRNSTLLRIEDLTPEIALNYREKNAYYKDLVLTYIHRELLGVKG